VIKEIDTRYMQVNEKSTEYHSINCSGLPVLVLSKADENVENTSKISTVSFSEVYL